MRKGTLRRIATSAAVLGAGFGASLTAAAPAEAYCAYVYQWPGSYVYFNIGGQVPTAFHDSIQASTNQWNNIPGSNWHVQWTASSSVHFSVSWRRPDAGFPGGAPGVTVRYATVGGSVYSAETYLNPTYSWNEVGNMNQANKVADIRTVTTHELGHQMLTHPAECPDPVTAVEANAAMSVQWVKQWGTNSDDEAGAAYAK